MEEIAPAVEAGGYAGARSGQLKPKPPPLPSPAAVSTTTTTSKPANSWIRRKSVLDLEPPSIAIVAQGTRSTSTTKGSSYRQSGTAGVDVPAAAAAPDFCDADADSSCCTGGLRPVTTIPTLRSHRMPSVTALPDVLSRSAQQQPLVSAVPGVPELRFGAANQISERIADPPDGSVTAAGASSSPIGNGDASAAITPAAWTADESSGPWSLADLRRARAIAETAEVAAGQRPPPPPQLAPGQSAAGAPVRRRARATATRRPKVPPVPIFKREGSSTTAPTASSSSSSAPASAMAAAVAPLADATATAPAVTTSSRRKVAAAPAPQQLDRPFTAGAAIISGTAAGTARFTAADASHMASQPGAALAVVASDAVNAGGHAAAPSPAATRITAQQKSSAPELQQQHREEHTSHVHHQALMQLKHNPVLSMLKPKAYIAKAFGDAAPETAGMLTGAATRHAATADDGQHQQPQQYQQQVQVQVQAQGRPPVTPTSAASSSAVRSTASGAVGSGAGGKHGIAFGHHHHRHHRSRSSHGHSSRRMAIGSRRSAAVAAHDQQLQQYLAKGRRSSLESSTSSKHSGHSSGSRSGSGATTARTGKRRSSIPHLFEHRRLSSLCISMAHNPMPRYNPPSTPVRKLRVPPLAAATATGDLALLDTMMNGPAAPVSARLSGSVAADAGIGAGDDTGDASQQAPLGIAALFATAVQAVVQAEQSVAVATSGGGVAALEAVAAAGMQSSLLARTLLDPSFSLLQIPVEILLPLVGRLGKRRLIDDVDDDEGGCVAAAIRVRAQRRDSGTEGAKQQPMSIRRKKVIKARGWGSGMCSGMQGAGKRKQQQRTRRTGSSSGCFLFSCGVNDDAAADDPTLLHASAAKYYNQPPFAFLPKRINIGVGNAAADAAIDDGGGGAANTVAPAGGFGVSPPLGTRTLASVISAASSS